MGSNPKRLVAVPKRSNGNDLRSFVLMHSRDRNPPAIFFNNLGFESRRAHFAKLTALSGMRAFFLRIALSGAGAFQTASFDITASFDTNANFDITASYFPRFSHPIFR